MDLSQKSASTLTGLAWTQPPIIEAGTPYLIWSPKFVQSRVIGFQNYWGHVCLITAGDTWLAERSAAFLTIRLLLASAHFASRSRALIAANNHEDFPFDENHRGSFFEEKKLEDSLPTQMNAEA